MILIKHLHFYIYVFKKNVSIAFVWSWVRCQYINYAAFALNSKHSFMFTQEEVRTGKPNILSCNLKINIKLSLIFVFNFKTKQE